MKKEHLIEEHSNTFKYFQNVEGEQKEKATGESDLLELFLHQLLLTFHASLLSCTINHLIIIL